MKIFLMKSVVTASLMNCIMYASMILTAIRVVHLQIDDFTSVEKGLLVILLAWLPSGLAAIWMFHKLQAQWTKRKARYLAIVFVLTAPVSLGISMPLAMMIGGYAGLVFASAAPVGAFAGMILLNALLNSAVSLFAAWSFENRIPSSN